jgi:hypothetical protein
MPDKDKQFKKDVRESSGYSLSVPYWRYKELGLFVTLYAKSTYKMPR